MRIAVEELRKLETAIDENKKILSQDRLLAVQELALIGQAKQTAQVSHSENNT